jgi:ABC-type methionine transport system ATPase subunit
MSSDSESEPGEGIGAAALADAASREARVTSSGQGPSPSPAPLRMTNVCVSAGSRTLLDDLTLTIPAGKITVIVGASGAGKSVLLRAMAGLIPREGPELGWSGTIELGNDGRADQELTKRVGIVFQQFALFDQVVIQLSFKPLEGLQAKAGTLANTSA